MCTDSCDSGFGVLKRTIDSEVGARWGRQSERFRYLFEDSVRAREHTLRDDPIERQDSDIPYHDIAIPHTDDSGCFTLFCEIEKTELDEGLWTHTYTLHLGVNTVRTLHTQKARLLCSLLYTACETHACTTKVWCSSLTTSV